MLVPSTLEDAEFSPVIPLLCLLSDFTPPWSAVLWGTGEEASEGLIDAGAIDGNGVFSVWSLTTIPSETWNQEMTCNCTAKESSTGRSISATVSKETERRDAGDCGIVFYAGLPCIFSLLLIQLLILLWRKCPVRDASEPSLSILVPSTLEDAELPRIIPLLCLLSDFTPPWSAVLWGTGKEVSEGLMDAGAIDGNGVFSVWSLTTIPSETWNQETTCNCTAKENSTGRSISASRKTERRDAGDCGIVFYAGLPCIFSLLLIQLLILLWRKCPVRVAASEEGIQILQSPAQLWLTSGQTAKLDCKISEEEWRVRWYKEQQNGSLHGIHQSSESESLDEKYSRKVNITANTFSLLINNIQRDDSGVYYCGLSASVYLLPNFGNGTRLIVTDASKPRLSILVPSTQEDTELPRVIPLLCLLSDFTPPWSEVLWDTGEEASDGQTDAGAIDGNGVFSVWSLMTIPSETWNQKTICTCTAKESSMGRSISATVSKETGPVSYHQT
ncbi:hypothetical protein KIL84_005917 [Mauremys mutica]|uniref:Ig-like domain-containing protein n=1 Tax=Mauremys mutica TaxID=74926 RepID=A0A9D3XHN7_9SAUR|nr:hypothetical protein KIL84_005917 [Mauremys mutica]